MIATIFSLSMVDGGKRGKARMFICYQRGLHTARGRSFTTVCSELGIAIVREARRVTRN